MALLSMLGIGGGGGGGLNPFVQPNASNQAQILQQQLSDIQQAKTIHAQITAEAKRSQAQRWQIMSELQTKIHQITAEVTVNKAKMADKAFNAMKQYISQ